MAQIIPFPFERLKIIIKKPIYGKTYSLYDKNIKLSSILGILYQFQSKVI